VNKAAETGEQGLAVNEQLSKELMLLQIPCLSICIAFPLISLYPSDWLAQLQDRGTGGR